MIKKPSNLKIAFFGNTKYSTIVEQTLHKNFNLSLVITIPDRLSGRKRELKPSPVKNFAQDNNITVFETDKLDQSAIEKIDQIKADFLVVADYGLILPRELLDTPKYAPLNVHHSLLPEYRGPSPAPTTILNGEMKSGVTIIKMTWDVDCGDILAQKEYLLKPDETTDSLLIKLNQLGGDLITKVIKNYGQLEARTQDESKATYTHRFTKEDGQIDLNDPPGPVTLDRMIRAFYPWPGVWAETKEVESGKSKVESRKIKFLPNLNYPTTQPSNYPTNFLIQPEGKKPMTAKEFLNGYPSLKPFISKILDY